MQQPPPPQQQQPPLNPNQPQIVSPFPQPPDYARLYTNERLQNGSALPPPPVQSDFVVFGEEYHLDDHIIRSLSSQKIQQLYSNKADWKSELKKLNRSVVAAFGDLIEMLINCPDHPDRAEKMNDIGTLFINMHHLINEYRPVQARDTIELMQSEQLRELRAITERFRGHLETGKTALRNSLDLSKLQLAAVPPIPRGLGLSDRDEEDEPTTLVKMESGTEKEEKQEEKASSTRPVVLRQRQENEAELLL